MEKYIIQAKNKVTGEVMVLRTIPSVLDVKFLEDGFKLSMGNDFEIFTTMEK